MSQDNLITLKHSEKDANGKEINKEYIETSRNKRKFANADKLKIKKFSKKLNKRVVFVETKKMYKK